MTAPHHTISMQHAEEKCTLHLAASRDTWYNCMLRMSFACFQIIKVLRVWWASVQVEVQASVASTMQHASQVGLMRQWGFLATLAVTLLRSGVVLWDRMLG